MKRASYRDAIEWLAWNDDTHWLDDDEPQISVSTALVADLFRVDEKKVENDLRREVKKRDKELASE